MKLADIIAKKMNESGFGEADFDDIRKHTIEDFIHDLKKTYILLCIRDIAKALRKKLESNEFEIIHGIKGKISEFTDKEKVIV